MSPAALITHSVVIVTLIICYTVLTALGHDGSDLLVVLGGYIGGAAAQGAATKVSDSKSGTGG